LEAALAFIFVLGLFALLAGALRWFGGRRERGLALRLLDRADALESAAAHHARPHGRDAAPSCNGSPPTSGPSRHASLDAQPHRAARRCANLLEHRHLDRAARPGPPRARPNSTRACAAASHRALFATIADQAGPAGERRRGELIDVTQASLEQAAREPAALKRAGRRAGAGWPHDARCCWRRPRAIGSELLARLRPALRGRRSPGSTKLHCAGEAPLALAQRLARGEGCRRSQSSNGGAVVIGSDQVAESRRASRSASRATTHERARGQLQSTAAGNAVQFHTAVCVIGSRRQSRARLRRHHARGDSAHSTTPRSNATSSAEQHLTTAPAASSREGLRCKRCSKRIEIAAIRPALIGLPLIALARNLARLRLSPALTQHLF
jgi:hypothetical protein